jgi:allophanate hydrolase subunit 2
MTLLARETRVTVATDDGALHALEAGASLAITPPAGARVRYLAVRGGIDVPLVLGSRSTLLVAAFGGFEGRALRRGDVLPVGADAPSAAFGSAHPPLDFDRPIRVVLGPDLARFADSAPETLLSSAFMLAPSSDRTGANLIGPALARKPNDEPRSSPMVAGAIEVTGRGDAIVLGPDHPTTGGYPILAVVLSADRGLFHARQPGVLVRFMRV